LRASVKEILHDIFICWSGTRSRTIAEAVEDLLKDAV